MLDAADFFGKLWLLEEAGQNDLRVFSSCSAHPSCLPIIHFPEFQVQSRQTVTSRVAKRAILIRERLFLVRRFRSGLEQQVAEADGTIEPVPDSVRSTVRDGPRHPLEEQLVSGPTVKVVEADDSAHQVIILVLAEWAKW
jgi:hypothetical protein